MKKYRQKIYKMVFIRCKYLKNKNKSHYEDKIDKMFFFSS